MNEIFEYKGHDDTLVTGYKWTPEVGVKAVLIISHGMAEHMERYSSAAAFFNSRGIAVWGKDHRGHGKKAKEEESLGYFSVDEGWEKVLSDLIILGENAAKTYPGIPLFLLGHSMGSFLSRDLIAGHGDLWSGIILSGTGYTGPALIKVLNLIARYEIKHLGDRHRSTRLDKLSFGSFNGKFKTNRTDFDWLSRDEKQVDSYVSDPLCGYVCTSSFFEDLSTGLARIIDMSRIEKIPKDLPVLLASGEMDPVGGHKGSGVKKVASLFRQAGISHVEVELYPGARHEILNETNREEVYNRFSRFIEEHS